jgi:uncharacterized repeat protein (TIGR01451 family)
MLALALALAMAVPALASEIQLAKDTDPDTPNIYYLGDTIHYVMNVTNPSGNAATNYLALVEDILPDGSNVTLATGVTQVPGASNVYYQDYVVDQADLQLISGRWRVRNYLHVVGNDSAQDLIDATTSRTSIILRPAISIDKTVDFNGDHVYHDSESNVAGQNATWKVVVTNIGYDPVYNVTVSDTNFHGFGAPFDLAVGANMTFTYDEVINAGKVNTATAAGADELGNPVGPVQDDAEVTVGTPSVGGTAFPVDKTRLLVPWVALLGCAAAVTLLVLRKRRQA